jgi:hypothetical protein
LVVGRIEGVGAALGRCRGGELGVEARSCVGGSVAHGAAGCDEPLAEAALDVPGRVDCGPIVGCGDRLADGVRVVAGCEIVGDGVREAVEAEQGGIVGWGFGG